ncbi:MAG: hypothetical protein PHI40_00225 [Caldisericia bacterium]|nr:hypothetical protein [Candidatus Nanoarchaeia archaeon]MDD4613825.1 hypothetical protein [Caldisericia bacterium]
MTTVAEMRADLLVTAEILEQFNQGMECRFRWGIGESERITGATLVDDPRRSGRFVEVG